MKSQLEYVVERIAELREEIENLIDYLDLLEARAVNSGKKRCTTEQIKEMLELVGAERGSPFAPSRRRIS